jgi:hypothetical protein
MAKKACVIAIKTSHIFAVQCSTEITGSLVSMQRRGAIFYKIIKTFMRIIQTWNAYSNYSNYPI